MCVCIWLRGCQRPRKEILPRNREPQSTRSKWNTDQLTNLPIKHTIGRWPSIRGPSWAWRRKVEDEHRFADFSPQASFLRKRRTAYCAHSLNHELKPSPNSCQSTQDLGSHGNSASSYTNNRCDGRKYGVVAGPGF